ncbi:putative toxin-antitoxin system toxin component, PIN family [Clostridium botulinum]
MRVVVDTNVFIGAFFENNQECQLILREEHKGEFQLIMSSKMQEELLRILEKSIKEYEVNREEALPVIKILSRALLRAEQIKPKKKFTKCEDNMDNMFFECAIEGNANVIISKDAHIHALKNKDTPIVNNNKEKIKIMYPDEFIMELKKIKLVTNFNSR